MRFQIACKYSAHGYASPEDFLEAEYGGRDLDEVVGEYLEAMLPTGELDPGSTTRLRELVGLVVDFYCGAAPGGTTTLPALNPAWRKALHTACDDLQALAHQAGDPRTLTHESAADEGRGGRSKAICLAVA